MSPPQRAGRNFREFFGLAGDAALLIPRWLVLRAVGAVFIVVFAGIVVDAAALIGPRGVVPLGEFFTEWAQKYPSAVEGLLRAPSLFWINSSPGMIAAVAWTGLAAAVALLLNLWPRAALFACWLCLLSFVTTWRGFTATQVDQLMLETALLCLPFAPAGLRPGLGTAPRPIAVFTVRWLLFRVMFESGLVKIFAGDPHWLNLTALDVLYETSPFPTLLGYLDHQLPHAWHVGEIALTFAAEIAAPLAAVFAGRRARWLAFGVWTVFQIGIQLTNNFGWLNTASIGLGLLLLDDRMVADAVERLGRGRFVHLAKWSPSSDPAAANAAPDLAPSTRSGRWPTLGLRLALGTHFVLTLYFLALGCGLPVDGFPYAVARPLKILFWDFRSANFYTLFAGMLPARVAVEFEGSNDAGRTWRPYEFRYQPQREDAMSPFLAPRYARFEATLQVEANRAEPSPLFALVAARLLTRSPEVMGQFLRDPFPDRPPTLIRMPVYRLKFTDFSKYLKTGYYWHKEFSAFHQPLLHLDARGVAVVATSAFDELRAQAEQGNPQAQYLVGVACARGEGTSQNLAEAARWYRLAGEQDVTAAQGRLGSLYANGEGVPRDPREAAKWFRRAAELGNPYAQTNLALLYAQGAGVPQDETEALVWFKVAASFGDPDAIRNQAVATQRVGPMAALAAERRSLQLREEINTRLKAR